jgi:diacylglycerol kinase family enzyme
MGRSLRTVCVFVGNNFYDLSHFGGRTRLDEGRLCVYIVKKQTWIGLILLPILIGLGRVNPEADVELLTSGEVQISAKSKHMHVALDGEASVMATPLIYRSRPGALLVLCPP